MHFLHVTIFDEGKKNQFFELTTKKNTNKTLKRNVNMYVCACDTMSKAARQQLNKMRKMCFNLYYITHFPKKKEKKNESVKEENDHC